MSALDGTGTDGTGTQRGAGAPQSAPWGIYAGNVVTTMMWSVAFVVGALAVDTTDPIVVAAQRFVVAGIGFAVVFTVTRSWTIPSKQVLALIVSGAAFGIFIYNIGFFIGLERSTTTRGVLIVATMPAWAILLDALLAWRLPPARQILGVVLSFVGVGVLLGGAVLDGARLNSGDVGFIIAPISWVVYSVFLRKTGGQIPMFVATGYSVMLGSALLVLFTILTGRPGAISLDLLNLDILYMGIFATLVGFGLWFKGIATIGTARTSVFVNLVPIWGVGLAAAVLGENINLQVIAALVLVIAGVVIVQTSGEQGKTATPGA